MKFSLSWIYLALSALCADSAASGAETCAAPDLQQPLTLKYWNGRGLMEIGRMILAVAGKFPGDYEDGRYSAPVENLESNLGRMPVITYGDESVGQSVAIHYFLAAEMELLGTSHMEAAQIIAVYEHLREMMLSYRNVVPAGEAPTAEASDTWFDSGSTDVAGTADSSKRSTRFLTWWMGRIENALGGNGFAVGEKISLADILLYFYFAETLTDAEAPEGFDAFKRAPFGDKARTDAAVSRHPKIAASIDAVKGNQNFQKWLTIRGPQGF